MTQVNTDYPGIPIPVSVPFNAADFAATLSMTWTVGALDVTEFSYAIQGNLMFLWLNLTTTTVGGTVTGANLTLKLPAGAVAAKSETFTALAAPGGGSLEGCAVAATAGSNLLTILRYASNWVLGADNTAVAFGIVLRIQ
jgi:hypothetical protein